MEVILLEDVKGLGKRGDRTNVAAGYARNFLIPLRKAISAEGSGAQVFEEKQKQFEVEQRKQRKEAEKLAEELHEVSCTISAKAGDDDRLFGSVTVQDIFQSLTSQGIQIDKKMILLEEPIKQLGVYTVGVRIHRDIETDIKVWVVRE